jgi:uncharacterized protein
MLALKYFNKIYKMRNFASVILIILSTFMNAQNTPELFQNLPFGSIKPSGWLKAQMQKDVDGYLGNLDKSVPDLINDPIYGTGRLHKNSESKDLGNLKAGDAAGSDQYKWWNSETQSNWWDAYIRNVFLLNDAAGIKKVETYIKQILATQDEDGYLGIYDKELRYNFNSENGELWAKATLYRGLLAYYEFTKDEKVFLAIKKAVENVMQSYPINASSPFSSGEKFNGGVSHGLTFTDVLDRMYFLTGDKKYVAYALFLYQDFSNTYQSEEDIQLKNILNPAYKLKSHGVHTFEHMRPLIVATYAAGNEELKKALDIYLKRIEQVITISGGAIGDEWIAGRTADATHTGYEYCSLQELLDSYSLLLQKTGSAKYGDAIEKTFYNAAQGARDPIHSCIAYLKTDNSFEMMGTKNGEVEADRKQTRYKYSPAHQDVAVCCNPNAGRISPYFVQNSWMKENENTLVATLLLPNILETTIGDNKISIETETEYPYSNYFNFKIKLEKPALLTIKIRKPSWVKSIDTPENFVVDNEYIVIKREFKSIDYIRINLMSEVEIKKDNNKNTYFTYGPLIYAKPIESEVIKGKTYISNFSDFNYKPKAQVKYSAVNNASAVLVSGMIETKLKNEQTNNIEKVQLIPMGRTILRQVTF